MTVDKSKKYDRPGDFFELSGSISMRLTGPAAQQVCRMAYDHDLLVFRVEGGLWHSPGFESRLDCIWNDKWKKKEDRPTAESEIRANNALAADFIERESGFHDVFIVCTAPIEK